MLKNLHIQNYALIDNLDIDFESGFSVITGETGAGKSILLGALALILGGRADSSSISHGAKKCTAEATFSFTDPDTVAFLEQNDLDIEDDECIIRRELTNAGKSRAFINDTPVSLAVVKQLSLRLIDIHSQHQNLLLSDSSFQLDVVDSVADNGDLLAKYRKEYATLRKCEQELQKLAECVKNEATDTDYLQFRYNELASANLVDGEQEDLEEEQLILDNAENIKEAIHSATNDLNDIMNKLHSAGHSLERISSVLPCATEYSERINSCDIELNDISADLFRKLSEIDFDSDRAEIVGERLNTIYSLQKKYHRDTIGALLQQQKELAEKLNTITNSGEILAEKQNQCEACRKQAEVTAIQLSETRRKATKPIERQLTTRLQALGMPNVVFHVNICQTEKLMSSGMDNVAILFGSNKNIPPSSLAKIASGGEIARVMLSLKALLSHHKELPTIVFDEIDTGVSGNLSEKMANVMDEMSEQGRQVICITHQPQIAASGQHHYRVYKEDSADQTHTHIERLTPQKRIEEVAKMLSGEEITEAAISNAKTLLKQ